MRFDEPPSEETLRKLIDEARGRGEETVRVETTREAGDAWVRAGFSEQARVLEASVDALEQRLTSDRAPSYGSVHVQTDDLDGVVRAVRQFVPRMPGGSRGQRRRSAEERLDRRLRRAHRPGPGDAAAPCAPEVSDRMGAVCPCPRRRGGSGRPLRALRARTHHGRVPLRARVLRRSPARRRDLARGESHRRRPADWCRPGRGAARYRHGREPGRLPARGRAGREPSGSLLGVEGGDHGYERAREIPGAVDVPRE